ncbi:Complex I intermediate-associated protein 30 (CIA30) [Falsiruegeria litorea R37]|uniref:Complex I intermediate-associated protein 30 (CIA30) n=1 Tax=Falsiruegeria litorea R37 TaxID=1200284 RepID=A0A1Y5SQU3_9RHOB|nr:CIA30 family protein [Falsiruegeria litorea]SLN44957.1 Complex I intermediate-associated protein 30 (CIA30) [Falsiruegeria litorea R37]
MKFAKHLLISAQFWLVGAVTLNAEPFETFENNPETRWQYVADTVMGGVSTGKVSFEQASNAPFARLEGQVSTANNGGFIQFRHLLETRAPSDTQGVRLVVRGNNQAYFIHLRTTGTLLPWQYYQASFETTGTWTEVRLPFSAFERSGRLLRSTVSAGSVTSVGVVAFGRDHAAQVDVAEIGFF